MSEFENEQNSKPSIDLNTDFLTANLSPETLSLLRNHLSHLSETFETKSENEIIDNNQKYAKKDYWEKRFEEEEEYEWLLSFNDVKDILLPHIKPEDQILIVGCGNSTFSSDLYKAGFENVVNIDFSAHVIEKMKIKYPENIYPKMEWLVMDMTNLEFPEAHFDVVIDKASMDALLCEEGDLWNPIESVIQSIDQMCLGISRALKPNTGRFLQITFAQPHFRTKYLMASHISALLSSTSTITPIPSTTILDHVGSPFETLKGTCFRYDWILSEPSPIETKHEGLFRSFLYTMKKINH